MNTIREIQSAIQELPAGEKQALAVWLQSQEEVAMATDEEAELLACLDRAAAQLDRGEGESLDRTRERISGWAGS